MLDRGHNGWTHTCCGKLYFKRWETTKCKKQRSYLLTIVTTLEDMAKCGCVMVCEGCC